MLLKADPGSRWGRGWKKVKVPSATLHDAFCRFKYFKDKLCFKVNGILLHSDFITLTHLFHLNPACLLFLLIFVLPSQLHLSFAFPHLPGPSMCNFTVIVCDLSKPLTWWHSMLQQEGTLV